MILLGGSALCLLGSERATADIDYVGDDLRQNDLQQFIGLLADELRLIIDPVPIGEFIPIPANADERRIPIGQYGQISVFVLDPYTIALSKLDRGFDSDLEDVGFLLRQNHVSIEQLEIVVRNALESAAQFDLNRQSIQTHLDIVRSMM